MSKSRIAGTEPAYLAPKALISKGHRRTSAATPGRIMAYMCRSVERMSRFGLCGRVRGFHRQR